MSSWHKVNEIRGPCPHGAVAPVEETHRTQLQTPNHIIVSREQILGES